MCDYFILSWFLIAGLKFGRKNDQIFFYDQVYWVICEGNNSQEPPAKATKNRVMYG